jgi:hypothetical protein
MNGGFHPTRDVIRQDFTATIVNVGTSPTVLNGALTLQSLITTFVISNNSGNSVFIGDASVLTTTGFEIPTGSVPEFSIENYRQPFEIQGPLIGLLESVKQCQAIPETQPFICWDPSTIYLVAGVASAISVIFFKEMFV